jgi:hypothetical protein
MFVVSTAVDGAPVRAIRTSAFWTAIPDTPSIAAMIEAFGEQPSRGECNDKNGDRDHQ